MPYMGQSAPPCQNLFLLTDKSRLFLERGSSKVTQGSVVL